MWCITYVSLTKFSNYKVSVAKSFIMQSMQRSICLYLHYQIQVTFNSIVNKLYIVPLAVFEIFVEQSLFMILYQY